MPIVYPLDGVKIHDDRAGRSPRQERGRQTVAVSASVAMKPESVLIVSESGFNPALLERHTSIMFLDALEVLSKKVLTKRERLKFDSEGVL
jgi:hypothetical protein